MESAIWKFTLAESVEKLKDVVKIVCDRKVLDWLHVGIDPANGALCIWARVRKFDKELDRFYPVNAEGKFEYEVNIVGTGHPLPPMMSGTQYRGTAALKWFVAHVYV